ncbi:GIP, partial [Symbiodinium necroappetens]
GIWGKQKTYVEPGAYEAEARATAEAEAKNEQAFEDFAGEKEKEGLTDTVDYQNFREAYHLAERMSPLMKLADQLNSYGQTGLYHDNIRLDKTNSFKVQHMYFRTKALPRYRMKFNFSEEDLMEQ